MEGYEKRKEVRSKEIEKVESLIVNIIMFVNIIKHVYRVIQK